MFVSLCIYQLWLMSSIYLQALADGVIPNEYGINPKQKLKIGSKVNSCCKKSPKLHSTSHIFKQLSYSSLVHNILFSMLKPLQNLTTSHIRQGSQNLIIAIVARRITLNPIDMKTRNNLKNHQK